MNANLELRQKTLSVLDWTFGRRPDGRWYASHLPSKWYYATTPDGELNDAIAVCPASESDDGLALDELVKFCDGRGMWFRLDYRKTLVRCELGQPSEQWDGF